MKLSPKLVFAVFVTLAAVIFIGRATAISADPTTIASVPIVEIPSKVKILIYHSIAPVPNTKESSMALHYRIMPETFQAQMQYLKDHGYRTITLGALVSEINHNISPSDKEVVLTFDDGWESQYVYAVPILEKFGYTATFGIITKNVGPATMDTATESNSMGLKMNWVQIKDLQIHGFEVASHSETHPLLTTVTDKQLANEISGSKEKLEKQLGTPVTTFIYPYYNYNARVMKAVEDAGYLGARAGYNVFKNSHSHLYELDGQEVINNPNPFIKQ